MSVLSSSKPRRHLYRTRFIAVLVASVSLMSAFAGAADANIWYAPTGTAAVLQAAKYNPLSIAPYAANDCVLYSGFGQCDRWVRTRKLTFTLPQFLDAPGVTGIGSVYLQAQAQYWCPALGQSRPVNCSPAGAWSPDSSTWTWNGTTYVKGARCTTPILRSSHTLTSDYSKQILSFGSDRYCDGLAPGWYRVWAHYWVYGRSSSVNLDGPKLGEINEALQVQDYSLFIPSEGTKGSDGTYGWVYLP